MFFTKDLYSSSCEQLEFYITVPLPSQLPEQNMSLQILFLPLGPVFGADQYNGSFSVQRCVQTHTEATPSASYSFFHSLGVAERTGAQDARGPQMFITRLVPLFRSSCCSVFLLGFQSLHG